MCSVNAILDGLPVERDAAAVFGRVEEVLIPSSVAVAVRIRGCGGAGLDACASDPVYVPFW